MRNLIRLFISALPALCVSALLTTTVSPCTGANADAGALHVLPGWNLVGNGVDAPLTVAQALKDAPPVISLWKWNRASGKWAFYSASLSASELTAYVRDKGFDELAHIDPREGFWVNASAAATLAVPVAPGVVLRAGDLQDGWNLTASADRKTPSELVLSMGASLRAQGKEILTVWAWDASRAKWKFYSTALAALGGSALDEFAASAGHLPFGEAIAVEDGIWIRIGAVPGVPNFTLAPANQTVVAGHAASFTTTADGTPAPSIQWQRSLDAGASWDDLLNDGTHGGVDTPLLTVTAPALAQNGNLYRAVARNSAGSAASAAARLTVNAAAFTVLHHFEFFSEGGNPAVTEALTLSGDTLYGATTDGGLGANTLTGGSGRGTLFSIGSNGAGFKVIHAFASRTAEGTNTGGELPYCTLTLLAGKLYGTATSGGALGNGVLFSINPDGTQFSTLFDFSGAALNTSYGKHSPGGALAWSGELLYGVTVRGGYPVFDGSGNGRIFAVNVNGGGTIPYAFPDVSWDGAHQYTPLGPASGLVLQDNKLYGITTLGGYDNFGTVFSVNTDGSGYTTLHKFSKSDGALPYGLLTLSGDTLYGTTLEGGGAQHGVIFSIKTDGTGFTVLHAFDDTAGFGTNAGVIVSGDTLYGSTPYSGSSFGTLFSMKTDGSAYTVLHRFDRFVDGSFPSRLILSNKVLYGSAAAGGRNDKGTVFSFSLDN